MNSSRWYWKDVWNEVIGSEYKRMRRCARHLFYNFLTSKKKFNLFPSIFFSLQPNAPVMSETKWWQVCNWTSPITRVKKTAHIHENKELTLEKNHVKIVDYRIQCLFFSNWNESLSTRNERVNIYASFISSFYPLFNVSYSHQWPLAHLVTVLLST